MPIKDQPPLSGRSTGRQAERQKGRQADLDPICLVYCDLLSDGQAPTIHGGL